MDVEPLDQLSPLSLPIRLTLLPVGLDLADGGGQLRVLLSFELQLLPEGVKFSIVVVERSTDQILFFCELLLDFGEQIVEMGILLVQVVAVLSEFSTFFAFLTVNQLQLPFFILQGSKQLLVLPYQHFLALLHHLQLLLKGAGQLLSSFDLLIP